MRQSPIPLATRRGRWGSPNTRTVGGVSVAGGLQDDPALYPAEYPVVLLTKWVLMVKIDASTRSLYMNLELTLLSRRFRLSSTFSTSLALTQRDHTREMRPHRFAEASLLIAVILLLLVPPASAGCSDCCLLGRCRNAMRSGPGRCCSIFQVNGTRLERLDNFSPRAMRNIGMPLPLAFHCCPTRNAVCPPARSNSMKCIRTAAYTHRPPGA